MPVTVGMKAKRQHDHAAPVTWRLDEEHLQINTALTETKLKWSAFKSVIETATDYYIVAAGSKAKHAIPKTSFESHEQEQRFRHIVENKIGAIKQKGIKRLSHQN